MGKGNPAWTKGVSGNPKGKPKGTKNRPIEERFPDMFAATRDDLGALEALLPQDRKYDAYEFLTACYQCSKLPIPLRMQAATTAVKTERPSLSASLTKSVDVNQDELQRMTPAQLRQEIAAMLRRTGAEGIVIDAEPAPALPSPDAVYEPESLAIDANAEPTTDNHGLTEAELAEAASLDLTPEHYRRLRDMSLAREKANQTEG